MATAVLIIWFAAFVIAFVDGIIQLIPVMDDGFYSVAFNDGIKRLVINCFYIYISFILFRIVYYQKGKFINLLSEEGREKIAKLARALMALPLQKWFSISSLITTFCQGLMISQLLTL